MAMITGSLSVVELVNGIIAVIGMIISFAGWRIAKDDFVAVRKTGFNGARIAQALTNLRIQRILTICSFLFLLSAIISGLLPGGVLLDLDLPISVAPIAISLVNVLIMNMSIIIQNNRWTILRFREGDRARKTL